MTRQLVAIGQNERAALHQSLVDEADEAETEVAQAERMASNYGGGGNEALLLAAKRKLETCRVRLRIHEGRP